MSMMNLLFGMALKEYLDLVERITGKKYTIGEKFKPYDKSKTYKQAVSQPELKEKEGNRMCQTEI